MARWVFQSHREVLFIGLVLKRSAGFRVRPTTFFKIRCQNCRITLLLPASSLSSLLLLSLLSSVVVVVVVIVVVIVVLLEYDYSIPLLLLVDYASIILVHRPLRTPYPYAAPLAPPLPMLPALFPACCVYIYIYIYIYIHIYRLCICQEQ